MCKLNKRELVLCHVCHGDGVLLNFDIRGPLSQQEVLFCTHCNGYGREYMVTKITYEPFNKK